MGPRMGPRRAVSGPSLQGGRRKSVEGLLRRRQSYKDWLNVSWCHYVGSFLSGACLTALVAKRKTLFDDRPVEISELTYVIKQDLASLNNHIAGLQALTQSQHPRASRSKTDQEGEHNDNVCGMPDAEYSAD